MCMVLGEARVSRIKRLLLENEGAKSTTAQVLNIMQKVLEPVIQLGVKVGEIASSAGNILPGSIPLRTLRSLEASLDQNEKRDE